MKLTEALNISSMTSCKFSSLLPAANTTVLPKLWYFYTYNPWVHHLSIFLPWFRKGQAVLVSKGIYSRFTLFFTCSTVSLLSTLLCLPQYPPHFWAGRECCRYQRIHFQVRIPFWKCRDSFNASKYVNTLSTAFQQVCNCSIYSKETSICILHAQSTPLGIKSDSRRSLHRRIQTSVSFQID